MTPNATAEVFGSEYCFTAEKRAGWNVPKPTTMTRRPRAVTRNAGDVDLRPGGGWRR